MKPTPHLVRLLLGGAGLLGLLASSGCVTTYSDQAYEMQQREDVRLLQEDLQRVKGRIEALELENQNLVRNIETLRADQGRRSLDLEVQALEGSLSELDRRLRATEAARVQDKQEIVDTLSRKVAQLVGSSGGGSSRSTTRSTARSASPSGKGYEHEVQPGETLSAIASAYGSSSAAIIEANQLKNPNQLRVGQKLFIPAP